MIVAGLAGFVLVARAEPPDGDVCITLKDGMISYRDGRVKRVEFGDMMLSLVFEGDKWDTSVVAVAARNSSSQFNGKISNQIGKESAWQLTMDITVPGPGPWQPGTWVMDLKREGDGLSGTYAASFRDRKWQGTLSGTFVRPATGVTPAAPGEHPKVVFRKGDLQALRSKAQSTAGREIIARMEAMLSGSPAGNCADHAAGHALLFAILGQQRDAEQARTLTRHALDFELSSRNWGKLAGSFEGIALAYDLCYDAWEPAFRVGVARELRRRMRDLSNTGEGSDNSPASAYQAESRGALGLSALAVYADEAGTPDDFGSPLVKVISSPRGFAPGRGVPVAKWEDDKSPMEWLAAGPFPRVVEDGFEAAERNPMAGIGWPEIGTQVKVGQVTRSFGKLPSGASSASEGRVTIELANTLGTAPRSLFYLYAVIENDRPRWVQPMVNGWWIPQGASVVYLAGQRVREKQPVKLEAGLIPVLVEANMGDFRGNHGLWLAPRMKEMSSEEAKDYIDKLEEDRAKGHLALDGNTWKYVRASRLVIERFMRENTKPDGKIDENFAQGLIGGALPMLIAYRNQTGRDAIPVDLDWKAVLRSSATTRPQDAVYALFLLP
jgi:hypothetical protein